MRQFLIAIAIAVALANIPAVAQMPSPEQQYAAARETFTSGWTDPGSFDANYPSHVLEALDGGWYPASVFDEEAPTADRIAQLCAHGVAIRRHDDYTLALTRGVGSDRQATTLFISGGGSYFIKYTEPGALLARLGDPPQQQAALAVQSSNGIAMIMRPSPDILVIWESLRAPTIFARCPT